MRGSITSKLEHSTNFTYLQTMKEKQPGFMELLDSAIDSIQHVRNHSDYDWIRKYGNTFLSLAMRKLEDAMIVNENKKSKQISKELLEELLEDINKIVESDFCAEMEVLTLPNSREFTQEEAIKMAHSLASVYHYSHQTHCRAHDKLPT